MKNAKWKIEWQISGHTREIEYAAADELKMRMLLQSLKVTRLNYRLYENGRLIDCVVDADKPKKGRGKG